MTSDNARPHRAQPQRPLSYLPDVVNLEAKAVRYREPRIYALPGNVIKEARQAIEFTVETAEPLPVRALPRVLHVGRTQLTESTQIGERRYRFYAYDGEELASGAPITLGWLGQRTPRKHTGYRYSDKGQVTANGEEESHPRRRRKPE